MARTPVSTGISYRHSRTCSNPERCRRACGGSYEAFVYSKRDEAKIRRTFSGRGALAEAKGWRRDATKDVADKKLIAPTRTTLQQAWDEWLAGAKSGAILNRQRQAYKPGVLRLYDTGMRLRVLPELGDRRISDIAPGDLLALKERMQGDGCSASTIRNSFIPLQSLYRRARKGGVVAINPALDLELPTASSRERAASPQEAGELLGPLSGVEQALWACAFFSGLRRGEMRALRVKDVDFDAGVISVERGWDDKEGEQAPKSAAGVRKLPLLETLRPYLVPLAADREPDDLIFGDGQAPFATKNVRKKALRAWEKENKERAEREADAVTPIGLHEARHSFSTFLDAAGISETRADRYMGHSNSSVARTYRHQLEGQMAEDAKAVDAYLSGAVAGKVVPLAAAAS